MKRSSLWLFGMLAIVIVAIAGWMLTKGGELRGASPPGSVAQVPSGCAGSNAAIPAHPGTIKVAPAAGRQADREYERAQSLLPLVDTAQRKHDVTSLTIRARAFDECWIIAVTPDYFANVDDMFAGAYYGDVAPIAKAYVDTYLDRCRDLARVYQPRGRVRSDAIEAAAQAGSPWAKAKLFRTEAAGLTVAEADAKLRDILASHDPEAIGVLADSMATRRDGSAYADIEGGRLSWFAWTLASCALGRDCSRNGQLMRSLCAFDGICGNVTTYADLLQQVVMPPADFANTLDLESAILEAIRNAAGGSPASS